MSNQPHILVADDEKSIRLMLETGLTLNGFRVTSVRNGSEALAAAIREAGHKNVHYLRSMQDSIEFLLKRARPGDAILTVGAGNVSRASNELMVLLGTEHPTHHAH